MMTEKEGKTSLNVLKKKYFSARLIVRKVMKYIEYLETRQDNKTMLFR